MVVWMFGNEAPLSNLIKDKGRTVQIGGAVRTSFKIHVRKEQR
jgi:hypothetical protein